jgi:hypothetical protein
MKTEDFQEFHDGIVGVMSFYRQDVSRFALDIWWQAMKPFDLDAVRQAFSRYVVNPDSGQYPPKPADIVRLIEGTTQDAATLAWAKTMQAVGRVGQYQSIAFDDPIIHAVIEDIGGWPGLCQTTEDEVPFVQRRFEQVYRTYRSRGQAPAYPRYLPGVSELQNAGKGYTSDPPRLVGDLEKAKAVVAGGGLAGSRLPVHISDVLPPAARLFLVGRDAA